MSGDTLAIGAEEFAQSLEKFSPLSSHIAVAVSGGPDSMALAFCLHRWGQRKITALIIDHALRPESSMEAKETKARLDKMGIATEILDWDHDGVSARIHETARAARYGLLIAACHRLGIKDLFLGHQREDQAETILMRLAKGSGPDGLAGIAAQTTRENVRLLRPFLTFDKARTVATCKTASVSFVTDPSNQSQRYARGRLRKAMPLLAEEGLTTGSLIDLGARMAETAAAIEHYAKNFLKTSAIFEKFGVIHLDRSALMSLPRAVALRALSLSLRHIHDGFYPPERSGLMGILDVLTAPMLPRTFYGCILSSPADRLYILREPSSVNEALPYEPNHPILWDGRWIIIGEAPTNVPLTIRALGNAPHEIVDRLAPRLRHDIPKGRIRATLPALWQGGSLNAIPSFDEKASLRLSYRKQAFP